MGSLVHCVSHLILTSLFLSLQLTICRITTHPTLNFTVVINPASGPGGSTGPDANYTREIPRLNSYTNVRTVGYVSTNWTNRNIASALQDVETYSNWAQNASIQDLGMHGIFLDETPSSWNNASAKFLQTIASAIQAASGFGIDPLVSFFFIHISCSGNIR